MVSLFLYLFSFLFAALCAQIVQNKTATREKIPAWEQVIYSSFIMLAPIIIACFRYDIGIDYSIYEVKFNSIHNSSILEYYDSQGSYEYVNKPLVDLGYWITGDIAGAFAVYAILTLVIYEMSLFNFRKDISLSIGTLILLFLLYSASLNIVRQSLSIAIVFYSIKYVINKDIKRFIVLILIATGIHSSAFIAILFYFLYSKKGSGKNNVIKLLIVFSPLIIFTGLTVLSHFMIFERYFESYDSSNNDITASYILKLPVLILLLLSYRRLIRIDISSIFYYIYAMEWTLLFTASIFKWAFRLSYYSYIGQIILLAMASKKCFQNAWFYKVASILWFLLYFYVLFYIWERDGIFPYTTL